MAICGSARRASSRSFYRLYLAPTLLLAACGDGGNGPPPPPGLTGQLAYIADGLVVHDYDKDATRHIKLNTTGLGAVWGIAWLPDGRAVVWAVHNIDRGPYELHQVALDGSSERVLFPSDGHQLAPAFLPDGRLSYWVNGVEVDGERHGYEIFVDGRPFSPPLYDGAGGGRAAWAPDGRSVVIVRSVEGVDELIKVTLETGTETVLLKPGGDRNNQQLSDPVYSHAGDRLAFTRYFFNPDQTERDEIWVMNADGTNPRRLAAEHGSGMPTWSPDDAYIAFSDVENGVATIAIVPAAGGQPSTLVRGAIVADWR
jgi:WD40 repeat protein